MSKSDHISPRAKIILLYLLLVLGFGIAILWASVKVIWVNGDMWRAKASNRTMNYVEQPAHRGNIYSSDGKLLATTVPECDLYLDFGKHPELDNRGKVRKTSTGDTIFFTPISDSAFVNGIDTVCSILGNAFPEKGASYYKDTITKLRNSTSARKGCLRIERHVPYSDWDKICRVKGWSAGVVKYVDGVSVIHNKRFHTYGNMAECVVGFNPTDFEKKYTGLEDYYDSILRGQDGLILCRRLTRGAWLPVEQGSTIPASAGDSVRTDPIPGHPVVDGVDIVTTIDTRLQDIAHYALERTLRNMNGSAGCALLLEAETGNVLVSASLVRDSNGNYYESRYRNVAVKDKYQPGSVFKPVVLTAMYNDPEVHLDTAMLLPVGQKRFSTTSTIVLDHGDDRRDTVPLWRAVQTSSNVAFSELGWRFYNKRRNDLLKRITDIFPFENINPDITGTEYDCTPKGERYSMRSDDNFLRMCYGYTITVSPLRLATFYNALANGGKMMKPRFCKALVKDGVRTELPPQVLKEHVCSQQTASTIRDMLVGVVEHGTGDNIASENYSIAGKTGTAEKSSTDRNIHNITFVGFFPADKPKYTCLVLIEDVDKRFYGRSVSPVFKEIADCVVSLDKDLDCRPTMKNLMQRNAKERHKGGYSLPTTTKAPTNDVRRIMKLLGLNQSDVTSNSLWCTFTQPSDSTGTAAYVNYELPDVVPNLIGMTIKDALLMCRSMGLDVTFEGYGKVVSQEPRARSPIAPGKKIHLKLKSKK